MEFWFFVMVIVVSTTAIGNFTSYKKQKLIEEHRTNNLALAYQIISARPEISLDDVKQLMVMSEAKMISD